MNKTAIRNFAVKARQELLKRVSQRALQYGISADAAEAADSISINGNLLTTTELQQRKALLLQIQTKGYHQVMEEVAYTWFNRFCALRFMEVNNYLPSRVRVFSDDDNAFKPQILDEAVELELPGLSKEAVFAYKTANDKDGLFKYLIITQCNALSTVLPGVFQPLADYTELLFPDNQLREGSVIHLLVNSIDAESFLAGVQLIGWLYQFYISEKKDAVFAKKGKVCKDEIPARTQLFTPDWIVRYMVENSLGRMWVQAHPDTPLQKEWRYYLREAEQEPAVQEQLNALCEEYASLNPETIKCIDPCMGSGHILAYMFDVLMQIYQEQGYSVADAVRHIIEHNLYGLDIDERAAQLAYFTVMMKARQYDRRFFSRKTENGGVPQPHICAIKESNGIDAALVDFVAQGDAKVHLSVQTIIAELLDAGEYGSLLRCSALDYESLYAHMEALRKGADLQQTAAIGALLPLIRTAQILSQQYDVVVTNPPYMESSVMGAKLQKYVNKHYPDSKRDLFAVFIERCMQMIKDRRLCAMITQVAWMCLSGFEKLRVKMLQQRVLNMAYLDAHAFDDIPGEVVKTTAFVQYKGALPNHAAIYCNLAEAGSEAAKETLFLSSENRHIVKQERFSQIEGSPVTAFALHPNIIASFQTDPAVSDIGITRLGMTTADNARFTRLWYEVDTQRLILNATSAQEVLDSGKKWVPYNKGGLFRKWYGNHDYVLNWENDGFEIRNFADDKGKIRSTVPNTDYYFKECITWSKISSGRIAFRYRPCGSIFDVAGACVFSDDLFYLQAFLNSKVALSILRQLSPTVNIEGGQIADLPVKQSSRREEIISIVRQNITLSQQDWDAFETSWDFRVHPLLRGDSVQAAFHAWSEEAEMRFRQLKANEETLNSIFIELYGLQDTLSPEVAEKDITVRKADLARDIRSLISYAVGCMFGRYALKNEGLVYAGGQWDANRYAPFFADADNIIPICDDEYFEDDIVGLFVRFIRLAYGDDTLEQNLSFIAHALGGKGVAREVIRKYFHNEFYADHLKVYQRRPIYWQFDSGKKGAFRALVYLHRYTKDTLARMRTDYVHEQQSRLRTLSEDLERRIRSASSGEQLKLTKQLKKIQEQNAELCDFEELVHHFANRFIDINLDDGVKNNYAIFDSVLTKIK